MNNNNNNTININYIETKKASKKGTKIMGNIFIQRSKSPIFRNL